MEFLTGVIILDGANVFLVVGSHWFPSFILQILSHHVILYKVYSVHPQPSSVSHSIPPGMCHYVQHPFCSVSKWHVSK